MTTDTPARTARAGHDPVVYRRLGWWREETFTDDLRRRAAARPHRLALAARRAAESRTDTLSYRELDRLADRFAGALAGLGVRAGDVMAVQLANQWEIVPLIFACARAGAVICPITPDCPPEELRHRLELTQARVVVAQTSWQGDQIAARVAALRDGLPDLAQVFAVGGTAPEGTLDFHGHFVETPWEEGPDAFGDGRALGADDPYVVLFTSGTTGPSKAVVHTQNSLHAALLGYTGAFGMDDRLVVATYSSLCHYSGFAQGILAGVMLGGTVVVQDRADPEGLLDLVERHGATLLYGPPPVLAAVVAAQRSRPREVGTLRHAVIGTGPVLRGLSDAVRDVLGARAFSLWGMSESGPVTMTRPEDPDGWAVHSNGRPIEAMDVRIDPVDGLDPAGAPAGGTADGVRAVGRLRMRGAGLCLGYHRREDLFRGEFDADGWFDTGDLAREDGRGGIRVLGRASDAIVRGGRVAPVPELEALAADCPGVAEAAVVAIPGAAGEEICVVVVPDGGASPSLPGVLARLREEGVAEEFLPGRLAVTEALPRTPTGKVRKAVLREQYAVR
ncbi:AMP-binding protein [Actinacidiphila acididurans]|uniref:AMP-binding protein n=1 Tax=Actinacidiphila acididurans TaxID=2784346 RepID=A0ABS2TVB5_9ACTN|nr:AMP-binding protein [Actinacidiphila acididurans]MBM9507283.1 AMP-binding protein [Actinacidiphila acididurans]